MKWGALITVAVLVQLLLVVATCRSAPAPDGPRALEQQLREERARRTDKG